MEIQEAIEWQNAFKRTYKCVPAEVDEACDMAIAALEAVNVSNFSQLSKYRELGTVEELQAAREKQIPKKPRFYARNHHCPSCDEWVGNSEFFWKRSFCPNCGQAIDWGDAE